MTGENLPRAVLRIRRRLIEEHIEKKELVLNTDDILFPYTVWALQPIYLIVDACTHRKNNQRSRIIGHINGREQFVGKN